MNKTNFLMMALCLALPLSANARGNVEAGAKKSEMNFTGGTLTISADGAEILKTPLGK